MPGALKPPAVRHDCPRNGNFFYAPTTCIACDEIERLQDSARKATARAIELYDALWPLISWANNEPRDEQERHHRDACVARARKALRVR